MGRGPANCRAALREGAEPAGGQAEPYEFRTSPGRLSRRPRNYGARDVSQAGTSHYLNIRKAKRKRVNFSASRVLSYEGRTVDALVSSADEGRGTLR